MTAIDPADLTAAGRGLPDEFVIELAAGRPLPGLPEIAPGPVRLVCRRLLRLLPGRRVVAVVEVGGRLAVMKLFLGTGAGRYRSREADGCARLAAAGVATPALLGELDEQDGGVAARALLFEYLARAQPVDPAADVEVAATAARLARLHRFGYRHHDLHLENFLIDGGEVYVIDGDGVRPADTGVRPADTDASAAPATAAAVDEATSIEDLAVLCAQRPPLSDVALPRILAAYAAEREWPLEPPTRLTALRAATGRQRRLRVRRYLKKAQRDCTEFLQQSSGGRWLAAVRDAWDDGLAAFAADPEAALRGAEVIKAGNSATVVRLPIGGRMRVVKRYNLKGPWHALRRALKPVTRFRLAWLNGQRLHFLGIPTARPLLLLERRWGPLPGVAYLVMDDLGGRDLAADVHADGLSDARVAQVTDLFRALDAAGLRHGDTKASNFLVTPAGVHLVDLDALREGGERHKDVARFLANFDHLPEVRERFRRALTTPASGGGFAGDERPL